MQSQCQRSCARRFTRNPKSKPRLPIDNFVELRRAESNRVGLSRRYVAQKKHLFRHRFGLRQSVYQPLMLPACFGFSIGVRNVVYRSALFCDYSRKDKKPSPGSPSVRRIQKFSSLQKFELIETTLKPGRKSCVYYTTKTCSIECKSILYLHIHGFL